MTFGEPTGLELPDVEVLGSGRLLPVVGEIAGGVTEDITIVGGLTPVSRLIPDLFSVFVSTLKVDKVDTVGAVLIVTVIVFDSPTVVAVVVVTATAAVVMTDVFPSTVKDVAVCPVAFVSFATGTVLASILLDLSLFSELL